MTQQAKGGEAGGRCTCKHLEQRDRHSNAAACLNWAAPVAEPRTCSPGCDCRACNERRGRDMDNPATFIGALTEIVGKAEPRTVAEGEIND